jgi:CheY-like chemotaxis protein
MWYADEIRRNVSPLHKTVTVWYTGAAYEDLSARRPLRGGLAATEKGFTSGMQRYPLVSTPLQAQAPLILLFERNDAVAVPLIPQLRMAGYDVRAARIPVEVFDILSREKVDLVLIDLGNAAANRREFWVGLDSQRRNRNVHVLTFRYMATGETGELESGLRVARADVEVQSAQGFGQLVEAIRARVPGAVPVAQFAARHAGAALSLAQWPSLAQWQRLKSPGTPNAAVSSFRQQPLKSGGSRVGGGR